MRREIDLPVLRVVPQGSWNHSRGQLWGNPRIRSTDELVVLPWNIQSPVICRESIPLNEYMLRSTIGAKE